MILKSHDLFFKVKLPTKFIFFNNSLFFTLIYNNKTKMDAFLEKFYK